MYHSAKASVNNKRKNDRTKSLSEFAALVTEFEGQQMPNEKIKEAKRLLKNAAHVSDKIVAVGVKVFRDHGHEVYGTCFETDFQLVYWEKINFIDGTLSIDSDLLAMGLSLFIDLVNYNSANVKCKILVRTEFQGKIMEGSET